MKKLDSVDVLMWMTSAPERTKCKIPCEVRPMRGLTIKRYSIDFEDPLWSTMQNLGFIGHSLGPDDIIINDILKPLLKRLANSRSTLFANPGFVISAKPNSCRQNFVKEARKAQSEFRHLMRQEYGAGWRLGPLHLVGMQNRDGTPRWSKSAEALYRLAAIEGMLFIEGRQIHPKQWPTTERRKPTQTREARSLMGPRSP